MFDVKKGRPFSSRITHVRGLNCVLLLTLVQAKEELQRDKLTVATTIPGAERNRSRRASIELERKTGCAWAKAHIDGLGEWDMCTYPAHYDKQVSRRIQQLGSFEGNCVREVVMTMLAARKKGQAPVLVDVGGNIGMFSLAAAAVGIETHTFEPVPSSATKIIISAVRNSFRHLVHVYTMGASDTSGVFGMGFAATNQGEATHAPLEQNTRQFVQIPVLPLDAVLPHGAFAPRPVYLKMDIEGGECRALRGLRRFLRKANLIGAIFETNKQETIDCCEELVNAPDGAFYILHHQQSLCPYDPDTRRRITFEGMCHLPLKRSNQASDQRQSSATWPVNMFWKPC
mmetsp:Transcript_48784/g.105725  ORF Transcript_48784/g.105725 Transcript_48784/m.105725 type:complete len:343 (+) Transcript_48784:98-1126(+)